MLIMYLLMIIVIFFQIFLTHLILVQLIQMMKFMILHTNFGFQTTIIGYFNLF